MNPKPETKPALPATQLLTEPLRIAFPRLFKPAPKIKGSADLVYQTAVLIPPTVSLEPFLAAIKAAMAEMWGGKDVKLAKPDGMPLRACADKEGYSQFPDWHYLNARSQFAPIVVDQARRNILEALPSNATDADLDRAIERANARLFAGCWCRFHLSAFAWDFQGKKGVSFSLNAVQLIREDERLDGRRSAEQLFDAVEVEETPASNAAAKKGIDALLG